MATNAERTDQHVFEMLVAALASPELLERLTRSEPTGDDLSHQLADDEAQMEELARAWARREISRAEWMAARSPIEIRIQSARATMVRSPVGCQIEQFIGPAELMRDRWGALNVSQRRAVVGAVIRSITVHPAARGRRWDPQRFAPEWLA